jgi:hypothetical protein
VNGDGRLDLVAVNAASGTASLLIGFLPTRTTLLAGPNPAVLGSPVTWTATVSIPAPGYGTPTDSVRFFDGTTLLGTSLVSGGIATLVSAASHLGERSITAVYKGDGKLFGSISTVQTQSVDPPVSVDVAAGGALAFALDGVWPNPTTAGRMAVSFVLPVAAPARLELVDVRGRMIATRNVGSLGAGRHAVNLAAGLKLRAGIYLLRLTQGGLQRTMSAVVLD